MSAHIQLQVVGSRARLYGDNFKRCVTYCKPCGLYSKLHDESTQRHSNKLKIVPKFLLTLHVASCLTFRIIGFIFRVGVLFLHSPEGIQSGD